MRTTFALLLLAAGAPALQMSLGAGPRRTVARAAAPLLMAEPADGEPTVITDEQIATAAKAASAPGVDPFASTEVKPEPEPSAPEPFDLRIILYVSVPAVVLVGQLFFTFSRDMMAGDVVGPAVMDLWIQ